MLDFSKYPKKEQFKVWFLRQYDGYYDVFDIATTEQIGQYDEYNPDANMGLGWASDFELYKQRPEYAVGRIVGADKYSSIEAYETLIVGLLAIRSQQICPDIEAAAEKYSSCIKWLESQDFFFAPASSRYHDAEPHGLLKHTFKVYNQVLDLLHINKFKNVPVSSPALVALTHDWCKIGNYELYKKNVKDEKTNQWHQEDAYRKNMHGVPLGHGVTSMFITQKFFRLTTEEALAIRWHQGPWNVCDPEMDELQLANEKCPLVHLVQFADQLAIVEY